MQYIEYLDNHPPKIVPEPISWRGLIGRYVAVSPTACREALKIHERDWSDWGPDPEIVSQADLPGSQNGK